MSDLLEKVRRALDGRNAVEKRMFGGAAFMVDGALAVSAGDDGRLLVKIVPERYDELVARPGAHQARMGERDMGQSWLQVDADAVTDPQTVGFWVSQALDRVTMAA
jgi:TfoX/Sxy family transcriptional regulator of competence genes